MLKISLEFFLTIGNITLYFLGMTKLALIFAVPLQVFAALLKTIGKKA